MKLCRPFGRLRLEQQDEPVDEDAEDDRRPEQRGPDVVRDREKCAEEDGQPRPAEVIGDDDADRVRGRRSRPREHTPSPPRGTTTRLQRSVPQHEKSAANPTTTFEDRRRDVHADAEAEQQRPGDPDAGAVEDVDEQALLGADAAGRERQQRREALHDEHEQRVVQASPAPGTPPGRSRPTRRGRPTTATAT